MPLDPSIKFVVILGRKTAYPTVAVFDKVEAAEAWMADAVDSELFTARLNPPCEEKK